jgi:hypothetical protein
MPVTRSRKLMAARVDQLDRWEVTEFGRAIRWPSLGEEIGIEDSLGLRMLTPAEVRLSAPLPKVVTTSVPRAPKKAEGHRSVKRAMSYTSLENVERLLGHELSPSARRYAGPWYSSVNPLGRAIRLAGWRPAVSLASGQITFRRRSVRSSGRQIPAAVKLSPARVSPGAIREPL